MIGRLRWLYFLHYAGVGTFLSYFAPYLRGLGFSGEQIGAVTFAQQAVAAPAALIWGGIADRLGAPARALSVCTAGMLFAICGLPFARTPAQVGVVLVLSAMFSGAVVPLLDSTTVETVRRLAGQSYARTRLWGSIGFVVTAQGLGLLLALRGDRPADRAMPFAYLACVGAYALLAQTLPPVEAHPDRPRLGWWAVWGAVLAKNSLAFVAVLILAATTPTRRLLSGLGRLGVPAVLVSTLHFMIRYLHVLGDELGRMALARRSRTFRRSGRLDWGLLTGLIGMLLIRSFERGERVHAAMLARGWDGTIRTLDGSAAD